MGSANTKNGRGKIASACGGVYEGMLFNGKANGQGTHTDHNMKCVGRFEHGVFREGQMTWQQKVFTGSFCRNRLEGPGTVLLPDGSKLDGFFSKDVMIHGRITSSTGDIKKIIFKNGVTHEGVITDGKLNGKGKITFANGRVREGTFSDGKITFANGDIHEGDIYDGNLNGNGKKTFANGDVFEGQFTGGNLNGNGKKTFANGDVHQGQFVYGKLNGKGKITRNGKLYSQGEFVKGVNVFGLMYIHQDTGVVLTYDHNKTFIPESATVEALHQKISVLADKIDALESHVYNTIA